jgi:septal ring factor EnvC (AmiA/AmiB activator)
MVLASVSIKKKVFAIATVLVFLLGAGIAFGSELEDQLQQTREQLEQKRAETDQARGVVNDYTSQVTYLNQSINEKALQIKDMEVSLKQVRDNLESKGIFFNRRSQQQLFRSGSWDFTTCVNSQSTLTQPSRA